MQRKTTCWGYVPLSMRTSNVAPGKPEIDPSASHTLLVRPPGAVVSRDRSARSATLVKRAPRTVLPAFMMNTLFTRTPIAAMALGMHTRALFVCLQVRTLAMLD